VAAARHYHRFQGQVQDWQAPPALALRDVVPENHLRVYDTRAVMAAGGSGSLLELRTGAGLGITPRWRESKAERRPAGQQSRCIWACHPDDAADKADPFMQLCSARRVAW
jgi:acetyl-CoA carboxylase carboxyltransferase component